MSGKTLYITVINDLSGDQRVHRIASSLTEMGFEVHVVGRKLPASLPLPPHAYVTHRMSLLFRKGKFFYLEYNLRLFFFLLFRKVHVLNSCDLDTLLAGYLVKKAKNIPLVYDSHEYFTEVPELVHRPRTQRMWLRLERWIFPKLSHVYTVNDSLAKVYSRLYQVEVKAIRNLPISLSPNPQQPQKPAVIIYQGALNLGRGIELMIAAMEFLPDHQLWIVGKGDVEEELKKAIEEKGLGKRVIMKGFVPFEELALLTTQASLGLSLEENLGKNYYYASPNKLFDYIQARIPVLVSDLPEMKKIVETYGVGEVLAEKERSPELVARKISDILEVEYANRSYSKACGEAAKVLNWEEESRHLKKFYAPFLT